MSRERHSGDGTHRSATAPETEYESDSDITLPYVSPGEVYASDASTGEAVHCIRQVRLATSDVLQIISVPWSAEHVIWQRNTVQRLVAAVTLSLARLVDLLKPGSGRSHGRPARSLAKETFTILLDELVLLNLAFAHFDFAVTLAKVYDHLLNADLGAAERALRDVNNRLAARRTATQATTTVLART